MSSGQLEGGVRRTSSKAKEASTWRSARGEQEECSSSAIRRSSGQGERANEIRQDGDSSAVDGFISTKTKVTTRSVSSGGPCEHERLMRKIKKLYICFTRSRINFLKMNKNVSDELGQETQYTKQQQGTLGNSFSGAVVSGNDNTGVESVSVPVMLKPNLRAIINKGTN